MKIWFEVTRRCNLHCPDCYLRGRDEADGWRSDMMLTEFESWLEQIRPLDVQTIGFIGGEPTLWEPLTEAVGRARRAHYFTRIHTNGLDAEHPALDLVDEVRVTHYGAANARQIDRLALRLTGRLRIGWQCHYRMPPVFRAVPKPQRCSCTGLLFTGRHVYRCGFVQNRGLRWFETITEALGSSPFGKHCQYCPINPYYDPHRPIILEFGVRPTGHYGRFRLPWWFNPAAVRRSLGRRWQHWSSDYRWRARHDEFQEQERSKP